MSQATVSIRPVASVEQSRHLQEVQRRVWGGAEEEILPTHILVTLAKNGGLVLGAYAPDGPAETSGMIGFVVGWLGTASGDQAMPPPVKHCSHIAGVLPEWQGHGIGRRLKLAQRQAVLAQGVTDHVTWTYDPLYRPNGVLNIHSLGVVSTTYIRNIYGEMDDELNAGVPTDRCQVDWYLRSPRVANALAIERQDPVWNPAAMQMLPVREAPGGVRMPGHEPLRLDGAPVAVPLPDSVAALRRVDRALLLEWRMFMRETLEAAFAQGYALVDCVELAGEGWRYVLIHQEEE